MSDTPILEARTITKEFRVPSKRGRGGRIAAVDQVSLSLDDHAKIISLVGESGSGKTTLARMLLGLSPATSGEVLFRGKNILRLSRKERDRFRREVQPVFQDPYGIYNPFYRIERVLEMVIRNFRLASNSAEKRKLIEDALRAVDLRPQDVIGRYPHQLSGGERQRVMLARLYLLRPKVIIADEPVSMIDVAVRTLFLNILLDFRDQFGISCVFITHNLATAYYLGGDIMVMCFGRVVESGDLDQVVSNPAHAYTQQLLSSVPSPDPTARWSTRVEQVTVDRPLTHERNACVYAARCPRATEICMRERPPVFQKGHHHIACFDYQNEPGYTPISRESDERPLLGATLIR
jgi:oligopeptide/dipeptide ABC transporter ATP-binding protein